MKMVDDSQSRRMLEMLFGVHKTDLRDFKPSPVGIGPNYSGEDIDTPGPRPLTDIEGTVSRLRDPGTEPRGMFGIRGPFRELLGALGDGLLMNRGRPASYEPARMRERQAEALRGFVNNPMEAIERLSQVDPAAAQELYTGMIRENRLADRDDEMARYRDESIGLRRDIADQRAEYQDQRLRQMDENIRSLIGYRQGSLGIQRDKVAQGSRSLDIRENDPRRVPPRPRSMNALLADIEARRARGERISVREAVIRARELNRRRQLDNRPRGGRRTGGAAPAPAPAAASRIVNVRTPAEANRLPVGTRFRTPDGQIRER